HLRTAYIEAFPLIGEFQHVQQVRRRLPALFHTELQAPPVGAVRVYLDAFCHDFGRRVVVDAFESWLRSSVDVDVSDFLISLYSCRHCSFPPSVLSAFSISSLMTLYSLMV